MSIESCWKKYFQVLETNGKKWEKKNNKQVNKSKIIIIIM